MGRWEPAQRSSIVTEAREGRHVFNMGSETVAIEDGHNFIQHL